MLAFIDKVNSRSSELEDWLGFLQYMDDYLKNEGLQQILADYLDRDLRSTISLCYETIRRVCEDPSSYNPPPELFVKDDHYAMMLQLYDTAGDAISKIMTQNTSGLNKDLRKLRSDIQSVLGKFATYIALIILSSFDSNCIPKDHEYVKPNAHDVDINAALGMEYAQRFTN